MLSHLESLHSVWMGRPRLSALREDDAMAAVIKQQLIEHASVDQYQDNPLSPEPAVATKQRDQADPLVCMYC